MKKILFILLLSVINTRGFSQTKNKVLATAVLNGKSGCLDLTGKEVIPCIYDDMGFWGNNRIAVNIGAIKNDYRKTGGLWGYCNEKGELVIKTQYEEAESFSEGLAAVKSNGKWGFIDLNGKLVIPFQFETASLFREGVCAVSINKKYGFINQSGKIVVPFEYGDLDNMYDGVAWAFLGRKATSEEDDFESEGSYCLIDKDGKRLTEAVYKYGSRFCDGLAKVEMSVGEESYNSKYGFINKKGELIVPAKYNRAEDFSDGMAVVAIIDESKAQNLLPVYRYGYIDTTGKEIMPLNLGYAQRFQNGKAVVGSGEPRSGPLTYDIIGDEKALLNAHLFPVYGLIDKRGNFILKQEWGWLEMLEKDRLIARRAKFFGDGVINLKGDTLVPFKYCNLHYAGNDILIADDGRGRGATSTVLDIHNNQLLVTQYNILSREYKHGILRVRTDNYTQSGVINLKGEWVIKNKYEQISSFEPTE